MKKSLSNAWEAYDAQAANYFSTYNTLYFSNIHRQFISFLPEKGAAVLDIGCGSGRDVRSLARRGYLVTGVDPSNELLLLASQSEKHPRTQWINDHLPELSKLGARKYDFILISAVWMHIPKSEQDESIKRISELIKPNCHIAITLRVGPEDADRRINNVDLNMLIAQARKCSLSVVYASREIKDSLGRDEITWKKVVLKKMDC